MKRIVVAGKSFRMYEAHNHSFVSDPMLVARIDERFRAKDMDLKRIGRNDPYFNLPSYRKDIGIEPDWYTLFGGSGRRGRQR